MFGLLWSLLSSGEDRKCTQVYMTPCDKCDDRRDPSSLQAHASSARPGRADVTCYNRSRWLPRDGDVCIKT